MEYIGEHTLLGNAGHLLIIMGFVTALAATFSFFTATNNSDLEKANSWENFGKISFKLHSICTLIVIGMLFFMMANHYFEFNYVWKYSNKSMPPKYLFAAFWGGQQGSFLLWAFWHVILGNVLISTVSKDWLSPVLCIFALVQAFLLSMLMGVYFWDYKLGESPFELVRNLPDNVNLPWTEFPDYLQKFPRFQDGNGLNPLLRNYWMTIHPPTLFLGFAATLIPFAFAIAGIWKRQFTSWIKPALPWTYFGIMVLGTGILMGGAWAYEALSFGGFWAWDPVENASFVPWLVLVGAGHCMIITEKRNTSHFSSFFLCLMSFILVLYSTFLTRSGILGDSSVHSFGENGMLMQLLIYLLFFIWLAFTLLMLDRKFQLAYTALCLILFIAEMITGATAVTTTIFLVGTIAFLVITYNKYFPKQEKDDQLWSREFWMFLGALVLILSSLQITISTSIPVINSIFGTNMDAFTEIQERNLYYGKWQVPFAIIFVILMGVGQFLKYKNTETKPLFSKFKIPALLTIVFSAFFYFTARFTIDDYWYTGLMIFSIFAIITNGSYFLNVLKGKLDYAGSSIAHIGFGLILLGALISTAKSVEISENKTGFDVSKLNKDFSNNENILLRKGDTLKMGDYFVTYRGKTKDEINLNYEVAYFDSEENKKTGELQPGDYQFSLFPFVQLNETFGNVPEPGTKHYLSKDIFTHIKWADLEMNIEEDGHDDDYMGETGVMMGINDRYHHENLQVKLLDINLLEREQLVAPEFQPHDIVIKADLEITDMREGQEKTYPVSPLYIIRDSINIIPNFAHLDELDIKFRIIELGREDRTVMIGLQEREYIVMEAIVFPYINILWIGCLVMILGTFMAIRQRFRRLHTQSGTQNKAKKGEQKLEKVVG
ncbi:cytochrome c biogenesis protein CcsA [Flexithrix dorotheae]|uniref:cytochrome c biogenesis protein CcsA n=1 Tax=Flexithrix dorotheae TaxID=70993 RepID=UPI00035C3B00|nr:cytochrome c biogenesis protein CcsA [Flexithrix dorotheae]